MYDYALVCGRFQPFHLGHYALLTKALNYGKKVIIAIGTANSAPNPKNPFTSEQRQKLLKKMIPEHAIDRVSFCHIEDRLNNDQRWVEMFKAEISKVANIKVEDRVVFVAHEKDQHIYESLFPEWGFLRTDSNQTHLINATTIRQLYFTNHDPNQIFGIPKETVEFLRNFKNNNPQEFFRLAEEFQFLESYKKQWANTPYPVNFVTVDNVVIHKDKILLIRRGGPPGEGLLALPGGFVDQWEKIQDAALRELKEETNINIDEKTLKNHMIGPEIFDAPSRSLRGRIITFVYLLELSKIEEIEVLAGDDAKEINWLTFDEIKQYQPSFYSDHFEIVEHMLDKFMIN